METAEAGIVFSNLSFFGKKGEDIKSIQTFNEFLLGIVCFEAVSMINVSVAKSSLEFLGMEEATEPQMKALGVAINPSNTR